MSDVARICVKECSSIESVSVFLDGNPESLGHQLLQMDFAAVRELMSTGNFRSMESGMVNHKYNESSLKHDSIDDLLHDDTQAYYFYVLDGNTWHFKSRNTKMFLLHEWLSSDIGDSANI